MYLSIYVSIYLSIYLSINLSIYLFIYPSRKVCAMQWSDETDRVGRRKYRLRLVDNKDSLTERFISNAYIHRV